MSTLVVFYSRADENYFGGQYRYIELGNTEKVARLIAEETGAALFKIEQAEPYAADYDTCIKQAQADLRERARPALVALPDSIDQYDTIYLGYPNYWGDVPMAVYTFLEAFDWNGKTIFPFCTHEGSGLSGTERKIAQACKGATVRKGLAVFGSAVDQSKQLVLDWLKSASAQ
nr:flavodoxin [uncultured Agathobaculum sp.]